MIAIYAINVLLAIWAGNTFWEAHQVKKGQRYKR